VTGPGGRTVLPARVTGVVTAGCVVLPRNSTHEPAGCLAAPDPPMATPLRVRIAPQDPFTQETTEG
jgi:hypothetical protein